ncbi:uncharacterized protein [Nicotiana sylvestris]|uniref:uncharacterized protein n=1 Tax=Nicotiana sylvestris TaxID=4096 RepID=UPI00388C847D
MVADALSRKAESLGNLANLPVTERPLALDVQALANQFVRLDVLEPSRVLACVVSRSSLYDHFREHQYGQPNLLVLKDTVQHGDAEEVTIGDDGALGMHAGYVKYEHQRQGGLLQKLEIPEWKWERITMDYVVGLPRTQRKFDVVWVIMDRLTKSAHFNPVVTTYSLEQLAQVYIREIVKLHGVPVSIISDWGT